MKNTKTLDATAWPVEPQSVNWLPNSGNPNKRWHKEKQTENPHTQNTYTEKSL